MGQKKSKIFYSNAEWTKIPNSSDSHGSFEQARTICILLLGDHEQTPCSIRGLCKRTFVTDENGYCHFDSNQYDK